MNIISLNSEIVSCNAFDRFFGSSTYTFRNFWIFTGNPTKLSDKNGHFTLSHVLFKTGPETICIYSGEYLSPVSIVVKTRPNKFKVRLEPVVLDATLHQAAEYLVESQYL